MTDGPGRAGLGADATRSSPPRSSERPSRTTCPKRSRRSTCTSTDDEIQRARRALHPPRAVLVLTRPTPTTAAAVIELPRDLPILERDAVRLVVRDSEDRILLFHTHEITLPELGVWWELPGGGIDEGETYLDAAVRELREETGIKVVRGPGRRADLAADGVVPSSRAPAPPARGGRRGAARRARRRGRRGRAARLREGGLLRLPLVEHRRDRRQLGALLSRTPAGAPAAFLDGDEIDEPFELFS